MIAGKKDFFVFFIKADMPLGVSRRATHCRRVGTALDHITVIKKGKNRNLVWRVFETGVAGNRLLQFSAGKPFNSAKSISGCQLMSLSNTLASIRLK
jgi:hypothetical protein